MGKGKKWAKNLNRHLSKEDTEMQNKLMKRCSASSAIREVQIKITMRYHFTLINMAIIKGQTITSIGQDVEKLEPSYIAGGNVTWYSYYGKQLGSFSKSYT